MLLTEIMVSAQREVGVPRELEVPTVLEELEVEVLVERVGLPMVRLGLTVEVEDKCSAQVV